MKGNNTESWSPPLKIPAVEMIDLLSDEEQDGAQSIVGSNAETRDALDEEAEDGDDDSDQWSMYEEYVNGDEVDEQSIHQEVDACTLEESLAFRKKLKLVGESQFIRETVGSGAIKAKKLITAFGIRPPLFLDGGPDNAYYKLLELGICRELSKREKLPQYNTIDDAVTLLKRSRNIIVLTGAGDRLLTNFTQNIDNLEGHAGILPEKLIQCHGSFATATCIECQYSVKGDAIYKDLKAGRVARCDRCLKALRDVKPGFKRKRSSDGSSKSRKKRHSYEDSTDEDDDEVAVAGVMKPDITFFGEDLPDSFHTRLIDHDRDLVDLVLVIGTSLKVAPVSEVVGVIPSHVPQIYISREPCSHANFDIDILGDCDIVITELCKRAGWELQHDMVKDGKVNIEPHLDYDYRFSVTKSSI
ncbi:MAG: hypothetical protein Q9164_005856 [Protoblastenia rupestris]